MGGIRRNSCIPPLSPQEHTQLPILVTIIGVVRSAGVSAHLHIPAGVSPHCLILSEEVHPADCGAGWSGKIESEANIPCDMTVLTNQKLALHFM